MERSYADRADSATNFDPEMQFDKDIDFNFNDLGKLETALARIEALEDEFAAVDSSGNMAYVPAGRYGDQILQMARCAADAAELEAMKIRNRDGTSASSRDHAARSPALGQAALRNS